MRSRSVHKWMSDEMERLSTKLERYKPSGSGYNRIQPILLSRSVTQMLNNPLPAEDQIGSIVGGASHQAEAVAAPRTRGVLSRSESQWEEVYPTIKFSRNNSWESEDGQGSGGGGGSSGKKAKFAYYRNCSTRITT